MSRSVERSRVRSSQRGIFRWVLVAPAVLICLAILVYPLFYIVYYGFHDYNMMRLDRGAQFIGLGNYQRILASPQVIRSIGVTVRYTIFTVTGTLVLGMLLSHVLHRTRHGRNFFRTIFILPLMTSPVVVSSVWRLILNPEAGFVNKVLNTNILFLAVSSLAFPTVVVVDIWRWTPFAILMIYAGLQSLPVDPYEAAELDGASEWQRFVHITLPLLKPILGVVLLLRVLSSFHQFDQIYAMTQGGPAFSTMTFSILIYQTVFQYFRVGQGAALSVIFVVMVVLVCGVIAKLTFRSKRDVK